MVLVGSGSFDTDPDSGYSQILIRIPRIRICITGMGCIFRSFFVPKYDQFKYSWYSSNKIIRFELEPDPAPPLRSRLRRGGSGSDQKRAASAPQQRFTIPASFSEFLSLPATDCTDTSFLNSPPSNELKRPLSSPRSLKRALWPLLLWIHKSQLGLVKWQGGVEVRGGGDGVGLLARKRGKGWQHKTK